MKRRRSHRQSRNSPKRSGSRLVKSPAGSRKLSSADRLQTALKALRRGKSLSASARKARISRKRLQRLLIKNKLAIKEKRQRVRAKQGARRMKLFSNGEALSVAISYRTSRRIGEYLDAVKASLNDGDFSRLQAYVGKYIIDLAGKRHEFEVRPNIMYQLDQAGSEPYEQVYQYIV